MKRRKRPPRLSEKRRAEIGVVGGTGLYAIEGLSDVREVRVATPFGRPSGAYVVGTLAGRRVAFLARHGRKHSLLPSEINFRANLYGFKKLGVRRLISVSAVGSMRHGVRPRDMVFPDQFLDRTHRRENTFFGGGVVAHISFDRPTCPVLRRHLHRTAKRLRFRGHEGGTYICIEGPQFSMLAESKLFQSWGASVIGMTNLPEARLAREAEMCYATVALATDYDCWKKGEAAVNVEQVIERLKRCVQNAKRLLAEALRAFPARWDCCCGSAMENAVLTAPEAVPAAARRRLRLLLPADFFTKRK